MRTLREGHPGDGNRHPFIKVLSKLVILIYPYYLSIF